MRRNMNILWIILVVMLVMLISSSTWAAQLPHEVVWNQNRNQNLWTHGVDRAELAAQVSLPKPTDRGRVQIDPQSLTLVADNGLLIRGETLRSSALIFDKNDPNSRINIERAMDIDIWTRLVERHNLNTVRYLLYRPPQNWSGGPGWDCPVERCFPTVQDALPYIDAAVEIAADMGMYIVLDYHPVLGYSADDARAWWRVLAPRYKDRTHVIYELINEPRGGASEMTAADIAFQEELYQLVRSLAPETHIIMWSFANYSGAVAPVQAADQINYDNASVGYHPYGWFPDVLQALRNRGYPVIATEVGDNLGSPPPDSRGYRLRTERQEAANIAWLWLDGAGWGKPWENRDPVPVTWPRDPKTGRPTVTAPVIEPNDGSYPGGVNVSLSLPSGGTLGAEIRYTLDGSEPTAQSRLYQGPFMLNSSATVRAKAFKQDYGPSSTVTTMFTVGDGPTPTPAATAEPPPDPPPSGDNLITNGSFDDGLESWEKGPGHDWIQVRNNGDSFIATWPWNNYTLSQGGLEIESGQSYEACASLNEGTPHSYAVALRLLDSNGTLGLNQQLENGENCFTFETGRGSNDGRIELYFTELTNAGTRLDFDDLQLSQVEPTAVTLTAVEGAETSHPVERGLIVALSLLGLASLIALLLSGKAGKQEA